MGDEGGFAPKLKGIDDALDCIIEAIKKAGFEPGKDVKIAMDCAASEFCFKGEDGKFYYDYKQLKDGKKKDPRGRKLTTDQQINYLKQLITKYPTLRGRLGRLGEAHQGHRRPLPARG